MEQIVATAVSGVWSVFYWLVPLLLLVIAINLLARRDKVCGKRCPFVTHFLRFGSALKVRLEHE